MSTRHANFSLDKIQRKKGTAPAILSFDTKNIDRVLVIASEFGDVFLRT